MKQPIPANSPLPLKEGDRVRIALQWQDEGDDSYERIVVEAPEDCTRVLIRTIIPGMAENPTERIEARMLELLTQGPQFSSALTYAEGDRLVLIRNSANEYLARDGTWNIDRRRASTYFMTADKVAEQIEEAAKRYGIQLAIEDVTQITQ
jgi:alkanesulfonate monooxygenase SsuD/methylene tetrahydromethanopterin reductase-like flavin-dependent oxidoreductase (luciferase family)